MGLSWRAATGKESKTGYDFESTKRLCFLRYLLLVTRGNIASEMIIAMDESGVVLLFPTTDKTFMQNPGPVIKNKTKGQRKKEKKKRRKKPKKKQKKRKKQKRVV
jgi:hypothetical protein